MLTHCHYSKSIYILQRTNRQIEQRGEFASPETFKTLMIVLWVELCPPKDILKSLLLGPVNVSDLGKRVFVGVIKVR